MKNIHIILVLLFSGGITAQDIAQMNIDLQLSDSLTQEKEVRIYQSQGITNYSSLFRIYKDTSKKWIAVFYEHYAELEDRTKLKTNKRVLTSKSDLEFVFANLDRSYILELPSEESIQWKLGTRNEIEKKEYTRKEKTIVEYYSSTGKTHILDGEGFIVQAKGWDVTHTFSYSNPDSYLKHYPDIDELIYMVEILNIIRSEFDIWIR